MTAPTLIRETTPQRQHRRRRWTHPAAWWIWALLLAVAASRTTNPLVLLLFICALGFVVHRRSRPGGRTFDFFLRIAALIVIIRVVAQVIFGGAWGDTVIASLPSVTLPVWAAGLRFGGPVALEAVLAGLYDGLRLAAIILCVGAANALASPRRLLSSLPSALYEFGVSIVIALTFAPQLVHDIERVRTSRRLRGRPTRGPRAFVGAALPVLHSALDQSIELAAAMDARGYGRMCTMSRSDRRYVISLIALAIITGALGLFGLMGAQLPTPLAWVLSVTALVAAAGALVLASRRRVRTVYRPDPWGASEWCVVIGGITAIAIMIVTSLLDPIGVNPPTDPPTWPYIPLGAAAFVLVVASAGVFTASPPEDIA